MMILHLTDYIGFRTKRLKEEEEIEILHPSSNNLTLVKGKDLRIGMILLSPNKCRWYITKIEQVEEEGIDEALKLIKEAYWAAVKKHGTGFTSDPIHAAALVAEEAGEAIQAANNYYHEATESIDKFKEELAQTGAIVIRALQALSSYKKGT